VLSHAVKRVIRSPGLFAALLLGVVLASTFFAGINIGADTTAKAALDQQLRNVPADLSISQYSAQSASSTVWVTAAAEVAGVRDVRSAEVFTRSSWSGDTTSENFTQASVVGICNTSRVYKGLTLESGANSLGVNETYLWAGSINADEIGLNSTLNLTMTYWSGVDSGYGNLSLALKVVGFVEFDDASYSIVTDTWYGPVIYQEGQGRTSYRYGENLLVVDWENTFAALLDGVPSSVQYYGGLFTTKILVYLDRDALITPWDISSSLVSVRAVADLISQRTAKYGMSTTNNVEQVLTQYQFTSMSMRLSFFIVALPVFFVAWYVGTTVSDVSYNLRRREIGLMLTKGFSTGQLFRMLLAESVIIGVLGGFIGVGLGFLLTPVFSTTVAGQIGATVLSTEVIVTAIIFSLTITLLSTFRPIRRALKLSAMDALKEYMYVEDVKPYKQRWPWIAFALGTYKIMMLVFGINVAQVFMSRGMPFGNIFLMILAGIWMVIDSALTYVGPLLFFWGFTKIFVRGSLKFQELVARAARFLGELGALATKNVRRNPARSASAAFLIALIIGYSFQTVGTVASEQDYIIRKIRADVGADLSVQLASTDNASEIAEAIGAIQGVESSTLEYSISASTPSQNYVRLQIRAVDPENWSSTAYFEDEWFSGNDVFTAFDQMQGSNYTVILELNIARSLELKVGDNVTLDFDNSMLQLTVVGFFGYEATQQYYIQPYPYSGSYFWSYVPLGLYESISAKTYGSARVLAKLEPNANWIAVVSEITGSEGVSYVYSVAEQLETYQGNLQLTGSLNIQRIGVIFSILATLVSTGLVTLVSLQERKREVSIMSARGLSFKQLVTMLLAENLAIVVFAAFIGTVVGLIVVRGNVSASNMTVTGSLVTHRIVFPLDATLLLSACLILTFASAIIPVVILTKRHIARMERIVRL